MRPAVVYHLRTPDGLRYVGVTSQNPPRKRWRLHLSRARHGSNLLISQAIRKHSVSVDDFRVIGTFPSLAAAKAVEREIVEKCRPELNMTKGGDAGPTPENITDETRRRRSASLRGNKNGLGFKHSPETRAQMSLMRTGRKYPNCKSKGPRDTSKAVAISAEMRRGKSNPEHAAKMRGRKASAETRAKMSASQRARRAAKASAL